MSSPRLVLRLEKKVRSFALQADVSFKIGRSDQNALELPSNQVSRFHALIERSEPDCYYLYDLGSDNGTFLNGRRVSAPVPLQHDDVIKIGDYELVFDWKDSSTPAKQFLDTGQTVAAFHTRPITVLVVDIRDYTALAQRIGQARIAEVIKTFNRDSGSVLEQLGSWGQKYIGDAIMAVWDHKDVSAANVALAVLEGLSRLAAITASLSHRFKLDAPVRIGAGINSGIASVGNVGSGAIADYTALGDVVNKAFRLESCTKELGCEIAIGEETLCILGENLDIGKMVAKHWVQLKGYPGLSQVYSMELGSLGEAISALRARGVSLGLLDRAGIEL